MRPSGPILVATAIDTAGEEAVRQAHALARAQAAPLIVCHAMPDLHGIRPLFPQLREVDLEVAERARAKIEHALGAHVVRVLGGDAGDVSVRILTGSAHAAILEAAETEHASLVVLGSGSRGERASLGGVAERVTRHAPCPVRVVRAHAPGVVLAATDFSDPSLPAVEAGRAEAERLGAGFLILHAVEVRVLALEAPDSVPSQMMTRLLESEIESSRIRLEKLREDFSADDTILSVGSPADAILDEAARLRASLIVVGTHGRSGLRRLTLGSVAEAVLRRASCSMLIVRLGAGG